MSPVYFGIVFESFTRTDGVVERRLLHMYRGIDGERRFALTEAEARTAVDSALAELSRRGVQ